MFIKKIRHILLLLCATLNGYAQDSLLLRDYQFVKQENPWLTCSNAAGLTYYHSKNIAEAEAGLRYSRGDLTDYWQSSKVLQADVRIESFQRLSPRTVVYGSMRYNNYSGRNMAGSAFINPTRKPFDIIEDSLTNKGQKHRDTYQLSGAIGVELWKGYSIGGRIDYTAANYAKYKDLRHSNKLMDLQVSVGATGHLEEWLTIGANYQYHRNTESLSFSTYGKEDRVYKSLISYAAFMGRLEQFGTTGYTEKGREIPLVEDQHGGALQLEIQMTDALSLFADVNYHHGTGYYGRKSPYTISFTNHKRDILGASAAIRYVTTTSRHRLEASFRSEKLVNNTETYRELTNEKGAYYYEYYDPVKAADKKWTNLQCSYTGDLQVNGELPTWTLTAGIDWMQRNLTGIIYPYYRKQKLTATRGFLTATRNIMLRQGVLSASANLSYQKGSGDPCEDGTMATPSDKQQFPATMEAMLMQEYRYLTAPQYNIGGSIKYAFIMPNTRLKTHVRLAIDHYKANGTNEFCTGNDRLAFSAAIGCTF